MTNRFGKVLAGLLLAAPLFLAAGTASASSVACDPLTGGSGGGEGVSGGYINDTLPGGANNTGCNVLIVVGPGGSVTTSNPNGNGYYDTGGDDNIVGIINNSGGRINSVTLTGPTGYDIFDFDGDGACSGFTFLTGNPCSGATDPSGYAPAGVTFTSINTSTYNSGTVDFTGGIANGSSAWFSLEGPASLTASSITTIGTGVPEPATLGLVGLSLAAIGFARKSRKK